MTKISDGPVLLESSGISAKRASTEQLLAMKLAASRDTQDDADARSLLVSYINEHQGTTEEEIWASMQGYVPYQPGLKSRAQDLLHIFWQRHEFSQNQDPDM